MINKFVLHIFFLLSIIFVQVIHGEHRNISFETNPYCNETQNCPDGRQLNCTEPWLIYGNGITKNNTVHYLWGFEELPTFVMMTTKVESNITIDWCQFQNHEQGAIQIYPVPHNIFGISFQNLILFNDKNDTGRINNIPANFQTKVPLSDFSWTIVNSSKNLMSLFETIEYKGDELENNTKISINITAFQDNDRMSELPHLLTTPSSSQIDILLDNLVLEVNGSILNGYGSPRWAIDMIMVSYDEGIQEKGFLYSTRKSLDDEYTPGVFDLMSISNSKARLSNSTSDNGGYLQWRPVCYLDDKDNINYSTYPNIQKGKDNYLLDVDQSHMNDTKNSLFFNLFGDYSVNIFNKGQTNISFGLTGDGFYTKYNYTKWTMSMGLGSVPEESFSSLVIIVICVGVGVPLLIFLISGVYFGVKKFKRNRGEDTTALLDGE